MENFFDQAAQNWDKNTMHLMRTRAVVSDLLQMVEIRPGMTALEFGAGTGLLSFALHDRFREIILLDSSRGMIDVLTSKLAEAGLSHLKPLLFDLERERYNGGTFDVVFTQMTLHHVMDTEGILKKLRELLKPGGVMAIADLFTEDGTFHDFSFEGHYGFDPEEMMGMMRHAGFRDLQMRTSFVIKKTDPQGNPRSYPVFLIVGKTAPAAARPS